MYEVKYTDKKIIQRLEANDFQMTIQRL